MKQFVVRLSKNKPKNALGVTSKKENSLNSHLSKRQALSKQQSYLDLGQKNLGKVRTCPLCKMAYIMDDIEDIDGHRKFCKEKQASLNIQTIRNSDTVWQDVDKVHVIIKIQKIDCGKSEHYYRQFRSALEQMYSELGSSPEEIDDTRGVVYFYIINMKISGVVIAEQVSACDLTPRSASASCLQSTVFPEMPTGKEERKDTKETALLNTRRIVKENVEGVGDVEDEGKDENVALCLKRKSSMDCDVTRMREDKRHRHGLTGTPLESSSVSNDAAPVENICAHPPSGPLIIGIREMWVSDQYRRQGIATRMVEVVRTTYQYRAMPDRRNMAFSQPTADGEAFAFKYCSKQRFIWTYSMASTSVHLNLK